MSPSDTTTLSAARREVEGSRSTRRLRREGRVPGILYGGGEDAVPIAMDARELRHALAAGGAVVELSVDGEKGLPVVLKDSQQHPVRGHTLHVDLLRVRLDQALETTVPLELTGFDESPAADDGGVLEQIAREITIEALPSAIPDAITHDVSALEMNATLFLNEVTAPEGVKLLGDLEETIVATVILPRLETEPEEDVETEAELVGEGEEGAEGEAEGAGEGEDAAEGGGDESGGGGE